MTRLLFSLLILLLMPYAMAGVVGETVPGTYQWTTLQPGVEPFIDRTYTLPTVPEALTGIPLLRTANGDKANADETWVRFTLDAPETVLLFYDLRPGPPPWLSDWTETGDVLTLQETTKQTLYTAYSKAFPAGEATLPGPAYPPGSSVGTNYFVALTEVDEPTPPAPCEDCIPAGRMKLKLTWDANPPEEKVIDYAVYLGPDANASEQLTAVTETTIERDAHVLGLHWGDVTCFRVKARNVAGFSDYSDAACATLTLLPGEQTAPGVPGQLHLNINLSVGAP